MINYSPIAYSKVANSTPNSNKLPCFLNFPNLDDFQIAEEIWGHKMKCPYCHKPLIDFSKVGIRKNLKGEVQRYKHIDCKHSFIFRDLDYCMRFNKQVIIRFIKLKKIGVSPFRIYKKRMLGVSITLSTLYNWEKKFKKYIKAKTKEDAFKDMSKRDLIRLINLILKK